MKPTPGYSSPGRHSTWPQHEHRVIAGLAQMPGAGTALFLAIGRGLSHESLSSTISLRRSPVHLVDPSAGQIGESDKVLGAAQPLGLEPAHLTAEAPDPVIV